MILDRYVFRAFFEPFVICFASFLGIWLVFDLGNNMTDFMEARLKLKTIAGFYLTQLPAFVLIVLPVAVLLGLLFALGRMSRRNEIIAMLASGRSLLRVMMPLIIFGMLAVAGAAYLNYELAPRAERFAKGAIEALAKGKTQGKETIHAHLFMDRLSSRKWYVHKMRIGDNDLNGVEITQTDKDGNVESKYYADAAIFSPSKREWTLNRGVAYYYTPGGSITKIDNFPEDYRKFSDWLETPWRIASSRLAATELTVPELNQYLKWNSDFPADHLAPYRTFAQHRWAAASFSLVAVLIAVPLGIVFTRRGLLPGIATALFSYALLTVLDRLFVALGKAGQTTPEIAAWATPGAFGLIGLFLMWMKASNRDWSDLFRARRRLPTPQAAPTPSAP